MEKNFNKKWTFEAGTVEEAIENALKKLQCSKDELCIKVASEEKRGLFGMNGAEPAKIIVTYKKINLT